MLHKLRLPFTSNMSAALQLIAEQCAVAGAPSLGGECLELAAKCGAVSVPFRIPAADLVCAMVDESRRRGDEEMTDALEHLVQRLKQGHNRMISANVSLGGVGSVAQLDDRLEQIRKILIQGAGG